MAMTTAFVAVLCFVALTVASAPDVWPKRGTEKCTQTTKQKAMHTKFKFNPTLQTKPMVNMSVQVRWDEFKYAPWNVKKKGSVYAAYTTGYKHGTIGVGGYFGVIKYGGIRGGGKFLFSLWDDRKYRKGKKITRALTWPLTLTTCKRNCQDCGKHRKKGLTTGTQCRVRVKDMKIGDQLELSLERTKEQITINTMNYGGMPKSHHQKDRNITGAEWTVTALNMRTNVLVKVGSMLFEGDGRGLERLGSFDEMIGCNSCNDLYHRDTRIGPFIKDGGNTRTPIKAVGSTGARRSSCKKFGISGSKKNVSITFEGGPGSKKTFLSTKKYIIWDEDTK